MNLLSSHSLRATEMVDQHLKQNSISLSEFERDYQEKSTNLSKLLIVMLVLALSFMLMVINFSRQTFFSDHLLYAFEFYSFQLLGISVILANILRLITIIVAKWGWDWEFLFSEFFSILSGALLIYFVSRGLRIFYRQKWHWVVVKTIVVLVGMQLSVELYRRALFYFTMWLL
jgi:hypothetical protein